MEFSCKLWQSKFLLCEAKNIIYQTCPFDCVVNEILKEKDRRELKIVAGQVRDILCVDD